MCRPRRPWGMATFKRWAPRSCKELLKRIRRRWCTLTAGRTWVHRGLCTLRGQLEHYAMSNQSAKLCRIDFYQHCGSRTLDHACCLVPCACRSTTSSASLGPAGCSDTDRYTPNTVLGNAFTSTAASASSQSSAPPTSTCAVPDRDDSQSLPLEAAEPAASDLAGIQQHQAPVGLDSADASAGLAAAHAAGHKTTSWVEGTPADQRPSTRGSKMLFVAQSLPAGRRFWL